MSQQGSLRGLLGLTKSLNQLDSEPGTICLEQVIFLQERAKVHKQAPSQACLHGGNRCCLNLRQAIWPVKSKDANTAGLSKAKRPQADTMAASPESSIAVGDVSAPGHVCINAAQHTADCLDPITNICLSPLETPNPEPFHMDYCPL